MCSSLLRDVRFALRLLRRSPGFTAVAVLTIALGVGAATAIFSVVYGVFLAPLPYRDADALVTVWSRYRSERSPAEARDYREWKARATVFQRSPGVGRRRRDAFDRWLARKDARRHRHDGIPVDAGLRPSARTRAAAVDTLVALWHD